VERERTSVGLDVHARSVAACGVDDRTGGMFRARLCPRPEALLGWLQELPGPVAVVYEAGPAGYGLARFLTGRNIACGGSRTVESAAAVRRRGRGRCRPQVRARADPSRNDQLRHTGSRWHRLGRIWRKKHIFWLPRHRTSANRLL